jgi:hypothetical protein
LLNELFILKALEDAFRVGSESGEELVILAAACRCSSAIGWEKELGERGQYVKLVKRWSLGDHESISEIGRTLARKT